MWGMMMGEVNPEDRESVVSQEEEKEKSEEGCGNVEENGEHGFSEAVKLVKDEKWEMEKRVIRFEDGGVMLMLLLH